MNKTNYLQIQPFFEYRNHFEMIPATVELLKKDGKLDLYNLLTGKNQATGETYLSLMAKGAMEADLPWSGGYILHMYHFHHPWTHRGYLSSKSAADVLACLFVRGQDLWTRGSKDRAIYQLGRMMHLLQDIFIPQHAVVTARKGHAQLEKWLGNNWHFYLVESGGYYHWEKRFKSTAGRLHTVNSQNPYAWIDAGSHISLPYYQEYFQHYRDDGFNDYFPQLAAVIIPNGLRYSAGFINRFFIGLTL